MDKVVKIKIDVYWVGVLDPDLEYFDIVWRTPWGTSYNSYLVKGSEKIALIETVKEPFYDEYIDKIKSLVDLKDIDYIIMDHTEPDHSGALPRLLKEATNAEVIGSRTAITFLKGQINRDFNSRVVKDGDFIDLGGKTLRFIMAPFLHWPDTMFTYLVEEKFYLHVMLLAAIILLNIYLMTLKMIFLTHISCTLILS
jgi:Metallo-beta-lactamase superfamily.